jgi:hypothetical protein
MAANANPRALPAAKAAPLPVRAPVRAAVGTNQHPATPVIEAGIGPVTEPDRSALIAATLQSANQPVAAVMLPPAVTLAPLVPPAARADGTASPAPGGSRAAGDDARARWGVAVDVGKAVGRSSEGTAAATARFFTRFGKTVASSF